MIWPNALSGLPPTRWVGESGSREFGKLLFQIGELAVKLVVFAIADRRGRFFVIAAIMFLDLAAQLAIRSLGLVFSLTPWGTISLKERRLPSRRFVFVVVTALCRRKHVVLTGDARNADRAASL